MNNSEAYTVNVDRGESPRCCCMCFSLAKADEEFVSAAKDERNISGELIDVSDGKVIKSFTAHNLDTEGVTITDYETGEQEHIPPYGGGYVLKLYGTYFDSWEKRYPDRKSGEWAFYEEMKSAEWHSGMLIEKDSGKLVKSFNVMIYGTLYSVYYNTHGRSQEYDIRTALYGKPKGDEE